METEGVSLDTILKALGSSSISSTILPVIQLLQSEKGIEENEIGEVASSRLIRSQNYSTSCKRVTKWQPVLQKYDDASKLFFGRAPACVEPDINDLCESLEPLNKFEKLVVGNISENETIADLVTDDKFKPGLGHPDCDRARINQKLARLRAIMRNEQARSKRINKIKSKKFRRLDHKLKLKHESRVLSRLDLENPELAKNLREEYRKKLIDIRMNRTTSSRRRWARLAVRFGGSDLLKTVSNAHQQAHDERRLVERVAKSKDVEKDDDHQNAEASTHASESDDEDCQSQQEEEEEEDDDDNFGSNMYMKNPEEQERIKKQKVSKRLLKELADSEKPIPKTGLFGLKFMRNAIEKEREANRKDVEGLLNALDGGSEEDKNETDTDDPNLDDSTDQKESQSIANCVNKNVVSQLLESFEKPNDEKILSKKTACCLNKHEKEPYSNTGGKDTLASHPIETPLNPDKQKILETDSINNRIDSQSKYDWFKTEDFVEKQQIVEEAFVTGTYEQDFFKEQLDLFNAQNTDIYENNRETGIPGWGTWTGFGQNPLRKRKLDKKKVAEVEKKKKEFMKKPVIVNPEVTNEKYIVKKLPFPYRSKEQYDLTIKHPSGPEWNTRRVHKCIVQPRVNVRVGAVITPIQYAKSLPEEELDALLDAWSNKKRTKRTVSRL